MKLVTKTALVAAMAFSANAMAMQSLDDQALSAQTGQDGITLTVTASGPVTIGQMLIHDNDGLQTTTGIAGATGKAGAIVIGDATNTGVTLTPAGDTLATIVVDTDAGAGTDGAFLNAAVNLGASTVDIQKIGVAASGTKSATTARRGTATGTTTNAIVDSLKLDLGATTLNVQLGAQPQGAMIVASGAMTGGLGISELVLSDKVGQGAIGLNGIKVTSANDANLNLNAKIAATTDGLKINMTGPLDVYIDSVKFGAAANVTATGSAKSIGSVEINNMNMDNTSILVSGH